MGIVQLGIIEVPFPFGPWPGASPRPREILWQGDLGRVCGLQAPLRHLLIVCFPTREGGVIGVSTGGFGLRHFEDRGGGGCGVCWKTLLGNLPHWVCPNIEQCPFHLFTHFGSHPPISQQLFGPVPLVAALAMVPLPVCTGNGNPGHGAPPCRGKISRQDFK